MTLHPLVYQVLGAAMMIVGAFTHELVLVLAGAACAAFGLVDMTFKK